MALEAFLNGEKPKHSQPGEQDATVRFKLDLKEPTDETTNEFSYVLLVQSEREKVLTTLQRTVAYARTSNHSLVIQRKRTVQEVGSFFVPLRLIRQLLAAITFAV